MSRYAVIGDPVSHSLSPAIFSWLRAQTGAGGDYVAFEVPPAALDDALGLLRRGSYRGFSVTLPHKESILSRVDELDDGARAVGAANCVTRLPDGRLRACNTDVAGLGAALREHTVEVAGQDVVVLGAGGAGRAAAFHAIRAGARRLFVANRDVARAERLVRELRPPDGRAVPLAADGLGAALEGAALLINATSVGLNAPLANPLPEGFTLPLGMAVMDVVYHPLETALLRQARAQGLRVVDGLWMLVYQALEQLQIWTGHPVDGGLARRLYLHLREELP